MEIEEQKLIVTITQESNGNQAIGVSFDPPIVGSQAEEYDSLDDDSLALQQIAAIMCNGAIAAIKQADE